MEAPDEAVVSLPGDHWKGTRGMSSGLRDTYCCTLLLYGL
jgi:hypothetical protein